MPMTVDRSHVARAPSALDTRDAVAQGRMTAQRVAQAVLARIDAIEPAIRAWQHVDAAALMAQARALDQALAQGGVPGPLAGVPLAVKDIFDTADLPTTYGSAAYAGHRPAADAAIVARVRAAGALIVGKTVTTEFAYFAPGPTANPWNTAHTPGGSSSGSAAAVASGMVPLAFGSQTAGSLIRPASYCGVFALKPTFGVVPTEGAKPFSESLDTVGWVANHAEDLELLRAVLLGQPFVPLVSRPVHRLRLAVCRTHEWPHADAGGAQVWDTALRKLRDAGIAVVEAGLPDALGGLLAAQKTVQAYEAARSLGPDVAMHGERISQSVRDLVQSGQQTSAQTYAQALVLAAEGRRAAAELLDEVDALLVPAAPGEAPAGLAATGDPVFSRVWTLLGLSNVNVPGLFGPNGLPVGVQLIGAAHADRALLEVAATLHQVLLR
jgi:Asp-tRNA(Asn)/Glu-tRNA(Gln) amidotransferase A subunit family amidase